MKHPYNDSGLDTNAKERHPTRPALAVDALPLQFLHHPEVRQPQPVQRCGFQPLQ
jgi:hypothetical protein